MTETENQIAEMEARIAALKNPPPPPAVPVKLDLGCGTKKQPGFVGVDVRHFEGVDQVADLGNDPWPWASDSVDEVYSSHMVEHLTWSQRVRFFNELYRVLKKGAKAQIIVPHWSSARFYGDPTHQLPFSEFAWFYLLRSWRELNAPHVDSVMAPGALAYSCDFDVSYGYSLHQGLTGRNNEFVQFAMTYYLEARQDMISTLVKR
jgi:SAM-dependent methyltransferase